MDSVKGYDLAGQIIGLAMKIHSSLGSGFLESVYENALKIELNRSGVLFESQKGISVYYLGEIVGDFVCDFLIENFLIVELKATQSLIPAHEVQLVNYLAVTGMDEGLLLNFGGQSLEYKKKFKSYLPKPTFKQNQEKN